MEILMLVPLLLMAGLMLTNHIDRMSQLAQNATPSPTVTAAPEDPNKVWPSPEEFARRFAAHDSPEIKAEQKAGHDLMDLLLADRNPNSGIINGTTVTFKGPKNHRVMVLTCGVLTDEMKHRIPPSLDGYPIEIDEVKHPYPPPSEIR
jgi:hypothetical protein